MMELFALNKCCFCINQIIGCLILGYLSLVSKGLIYLACRFALPRLSTAWTYYDETEANSYWYLELISQFMLFADLVLTTALLFELHSRKRGQIKLVAISLLFILVLEIMSTTCFVIKFYEVNEGNDRAAGVVVGAVMVTMTYLYFLISVRCYYMQNETIKSDSEGTTSLVPTSQLFIIPA